MSMAEFIKWQFDGKVDKHQGVLTKEKITKAEEGRRKLSRSWLWKKTRVQGRVAENRREVQKKKQHRRKKRYGSIRLRAGLSMLS